MRDSANLPFLAIAAAYAMPFVISWAITRRRYRTLAIVSCALAGTAGLTSRYGLGGWPLAAAYAMLFGLAVEPAAPASTPPAGHTRQDLPARMNPRILRRLFRPSGRRAHRAEPSPPAVGPPVPDPLPLRPPGEDALDCIAFAAGSTAIAITPAFLPAENTLVLLWAAGCTALLAALSARASRQRWTWLPVGIAGAAFVAATASAMARLWAAFS